MDAAVCDGGAWRIATGAKKVVDRVSWYKFWKAGERYADRLYTASTTLMILKIGGYLQIGWAPIWVLIFVAFVGDVICRVIAEEVAASETDDGRAQSS